MKVYSAPVEVKSPNVDYTKFNMDDYESENKRYFADLKTALVAMGYTKPLTGELVYYSMGDGSAIYMIAEGRTTFLVHCDVGDAWSLPEWQTRGLRKADIIKSVNGRKTLAALFAKKS